MAHISVCCILLTVAFIITVGGTTIEIFDGNYYGIDDDQGVTQIRVSGPTIVSTSGSTSQDAVVVQPLPSDADQEDTVGRHGRHHRGRHHHRGHHRHHHRGGEDSETTSSPMRHEWWGNLTEEQKLTHICAKIQSDPETSDVRGRGRRHGAMMSWKLQMLSEENRQKVIEMWARRKQDMRDCCGKDSVEDRLQCVGEMNTARYERVCRGEEPLCPWAQYMPESTGSGSERRGHYHHHAGSTEPASNTTATCCQLRDTARVQCFTDARNLYRQQYSGRSHRGMRTMHGRLDSNRRMRSDDPSPDGRVSSRRSSGQRVLQPIIRRD